jgi:hypothetical protein
MFIFIYFTSWSTTPNSGSCACIPLKMNLKGVSSVSLDLDPWVPINFVGWLDEINSGVDIGVQSPSLLLSLSCAVAQFYSFICACFHCWAFLSWVTAGSWGKARAHAPALPGHTGDDAPVLQEPMASEKPARSTLGPLRSGSQPAGNRV